MAGPMASVGPESVHEGDLLADRYRIEALIGEGGYGRVYRATQIPLGRHVAVKVVNATDDDLRARFAREAAIVQRLEHPNTVRLLDHGLTPAGFPFLVFELLRGTSVYERLGQRGPLSPREALDVTAQILRSLAEAHDLGIVHRDIKPENIFLTSHFGQPSFVKVLDFGIARQRGGSKLTVNGEALGTPSYMAPEQALGGAVDARTDLYAVGLLLAEMVTGRTIMDRGGAITIMVAQSLQLPVPLGEELLRSIVGPLVERAVRKAPGERFQSAAEMLDAVLATTEDLKAIGVAPTYHGDPSRAAPLPSSSQGSPDPPPPVALVSPGFTTLASPATSGPAAGVAATRVGTEVADRPPPAIPPTPRTSAGTKPMMWALAIAAIVVLSLAVVVLLVRDGLREEDGERRTREPDPRPAPRPAPQQAPPEPLDPRVRLARTSQVGELRRLFTPGGLSSHVRRRSGRHPQLHRREDAMPRTGDRHGAGERSRRPSLGSERRRQLPRLGAARGGEDAHLRLSRPLRRRKPPRRRPGLHGRRGVGPHALTEPVGPLTGRPAPPTPAFLPGARSPRSPAPPAETPAETPG